MCGIAGFTLNKSQCETENIAKSIGKILYKRGPDDFGWWSDDSHIALIHTRLSILDLTKAGHQPMVSDDGRYILTFNGEIYNHMNLRAELPREINWNGNSDSETLLYSIQIFGLSLTLSKITGMFAFAVWDTFTRELHIVRDRLGEKPIYYQFDSEQKFVFFASSLSALKAHPQCNREISEYSLSLYLEFGYIPAPYSIYKNTFKVMPGECITFKTEGTLEKFSYKYWDLKNVSKRYDYTNKITSLDKAVSMLHDHLKDSVAEQMISDVPVGAFLSGGVDSSLIVSIYSKVSASSIKTFTIGFSDDSFDEAPYARKISELLGCDHTEHYLDVEEAQSIVKVLPEVISEPFADSSLIPSLLVSSLAAEHVTVCLTGDGGDELFGGYYRYKIINILNKKFYEIPSIYRVALVNLLNALPTNALVKVYRIFTSNNSATRVGNRIKLLSYVLAAPNPESAFLRLVSFFNSGTEILKNKSICTADFNNSNRLNGYNYLSLNERMMMDDLNYYLPGDILQKVDASGMYYSLEARIPFLSSGIVDLSWQISDELKVDKKVPKKLLEKYLPADLVYRKKTGFSIPLSDWIRGSMKNMFEEKLFGEVSKMYFDQIELKKIWDKHISLKYNFQNKLWSIYSFVVWYENEIS